MYINEEPGAGRPRNRGSVSDSVRKRAVDYGVSEYATRTDSNDNDTDEDAASAAHDSDMSIAAVSDHVTNGHR